MTQEVTPNKPKVDPVRKEDLFNLFLDAEFNPAPKDWKNRRLVYIDDNIVVSSRNKLLNGIEGSLIEVEERNSGDIEQFWIGDKKIEPTILATFISKKLMGT